MKIASSTKSLKHRWFFDDFGESGTSKTYQDCGKSCKIVNMKGAQAWEQGFYVNLMYRESPDRPGKREIGHCGGILVPPKSTSYIGGVAIWEIFGSLGPP